MATCPERAPSLDGVPWLWSSTANAGFSALGDDPRAALARRFKEDGILVLPGFFPVGLVDAAAAACAYVFSDDFVATRPDHETASLRAEPNRRVDAWRYSKQLRAIACFEPLYAILECLYGRRPIPFQTLT